MWFVYFIKSKVNNSYYVGCTGDIKKRIKEHNSGKIKSIKHLVPFILVYLELYANKTIALKRELELKNNSFKKKEIINRLENHK